MVELAIIGQKQQPFAVEIEPADGVDVLERDEVFEGGASLLIGELRQDAERFIEKNIFMRRFYHAKQYSTYANPVVPRGQEIE